MNHFTQIEKQNQRQLARPASRANTDRVRQSNHLLAPLALGNQAMQRLLHAKAIQAKLNISTAGDKYEQEADRVAETVTRMNDAGAAGSIGVSSLSSVSAVQRMCQGCEEEKEEQFLQAKEMPGHQVEAAPHLQSRINALHGEGRPLSASERQFFEPRFGQDFSQVRIHSDARAAESAQALKARAYTRGQDIIFRAGQYAPSTIEGRRLIAHELTHVLQQQGGVQRIQRKAGDEPGTSRYEELVSTVQTSSQSPGVWEGTVTRQEIDKNNTLIHRGSAPIKYDENSCQVTVPVRVSFRQPTLNDMTQCPPDLDKPPPSKLPPPLKASSFRSLADQYIREVNQRLNGWYNVRFAGCEKNPCHGRDIPIRVEVAEAASGSHVDYEIALANLEGRSCVSTDSSGNPGLVLLYSHDLNSDTMTHEGGHMTLGHGDEYLETSKQQRPLARVREGDWSLMSNSSAFGNWSLLHERHFAFVPAFLNKVRPGCQAGLREIARPTSINLVTSAEIGYSNYAGGGALQLGAGLQMGLLPDRLRQWQLAIGIHGQILLGLDAPLRTAFLLGLRLSLDRFVTPSAGGFKFGAFAEAGGGSFERSGEGSQTGSYVEGGVSIGHSFAPNDKHMLLFLGAEFAAGTRLDMSDPKTEKWYRVGLSVGYRFH
jgi:hypothetical protein